MNRHCSYSSHYHYILARLFISVIICFIETCSLNWVFWVYLENLQHFILFLNIINQQPQCLGHPRFLDYDSPNIFPLLWNRKKLGILCKILFRKEKINIFWCIILFLNICNLFFWRKDLYNNRAHDLFLRLKMERNVCNDCV